jgi:hypothetical protein
MKKYLSKFASLVLFVPLAFGVLAQQSSVIKMVDCAKETENLKCKRLETKQAGSIGEGPAFANQGISDEITGGYIRGDKLIVSSAPTGHGAIIGVDLKTGNRTLIAGSVDGMETKGENVKYKDTFGKDQTAYTLAGITNVRPLPNGNYAVLSPGTRRLEILEVDAATGNYKLLWGSNLSDDAGQKTFENLPSGMFCETAGERDEHPNPGGFTFEVAKDGSLYVFARENPVATGVGVYQVKDGVCKAISTYAANGKNKVGSGYMVLANSSIDTPSSILMPDGKLLSILSSATTGTALMSWDLNTGSRTGLSFRGPTVAKSKGKGDDDVGNSGLAVNSNGIYTVHGGSFEMIRIDPSTGERTRVEITSGPLANNKGRRDDDVQCLWVVPNSNLLLLSYQNAIIVLDPKTGMSNVLSY